MGGGLGVGVGGEGGGGGVNPKSYAPPRRLAALNPKPEPLNPNLTRHNDVGFFAARFAAGRGLALRRSKSQVTSSQSPNSRALMLTWDLSTSASAPRLLDLAHARGLHGDSVCCSLMRAKGRMQIRPVLLAKTETILLGAGMRRLREEAEDGENNYFG